METGRYSVRDPFAIVVIATFLSVSCSSTDASHQEHPVENDSGIGIDLGPADGTALDDTDDAQELGSTTDVAHLDQNAACILLGDIPSVCLVPADPSQEISSVRVLEGPCSASYGTVNAIEFRYWERGYSCPVVGDSVTCSAEVVSRQGGSVVLRVDFDAVPLSMSMLHWQATQSGWLKVSFPGVDGGGGN
jgi:hypothetical protein